MGYGIGVRAWVVVHVTPAAMSEGAAVGEDFRFLKESVTQYGLSAPPVTRHSDRARVFPLERACFEAGVIVGRGGWASVRVVDDDLEFLPQWADIERVLTRKIVRGAVA
jgi:hypothetical protein